MKSALPFMALCLSLSVIWSPFSLANQTSEHHTDHKTEKSTDQSTEKSADHITEESTEQIQTTEKVPIILFINTANAEEIAQALPGIGTIKAQAIVALRDQLGGFTNIDQLLEVKGVGFATLERISELIVIE